MIRPLYSIFYQRYRCTRSIAILFSAYALASYATGFTAWLIYLRASNAIEYRAGYPSLLVGSTSSILFLSDIALFTLAFRLFILENMGAVEGLDFKRFWRGFTLLSIPILLLTTPMVIVGVCGVLNEDLFLGLAVASISTWGAILGIYSLFIHPIYAPCCALIVNIYIESKQSRTTIPKLFRECLSTVSYIIAVSIAVWISTSLIATLATIAIPALAQPIIPFLKPPYYNSWAMKWYNLVLKIVPRYYNLVLNPASYILYALLFKRIAREEIESMLVYARPRPDIPIPLGENATPGNTAN